MKEELSTKGEFISIEQPMVLINHARKSTRLLMKENGICYLRAGDVKGSLLIQSGFERLEYLLLHTNGDDAELFKLIHSFNRFHILDHFRVNLDVTFSNS